MFGKKNKKFEYYFAGFAETLEQLQKNKVTTAKPVQPGHRLHCLETNTTFQRDGDKWVNLNDVILDIGKQWPAGEKGEKGDKGDKGEKGDKGDKGEKGDRGADGKDGKDGADGKDGKDGVDGKDAELITLEMSINGGKSKKVDIITK